MVSLFATRSSASEEGMVCSALKVRMPGGARALRAPCVLPLLLLRAPQLRRRAGGAGKSGARDLPGIAAGGQLLPASLLWGWATPVAGHLVGSKP